MNKFQRAYLYIIDEETYQGDEPSQEDMAYYSNQYDKLSYAEQLIDDLITKNLKRSPSFRISAQDWSEEFGELNKDHATNCAIFLDGCLLDIYNNPSLYFKGGQDSEEYKMIDNYIIEVGYLNQRLKLEEIDLKEVMRRAEKTGVSKYVQKIENKNGE